MFVTAMRDIQFFNSTFRAPEGDSGEAIISSARTMRILAGEEEMPPLSTMKRRNLRLVKKGPTHGAADNMGTIGPVNSPEEY